MELLKELPEDFPLWNFRNSWRKSYRKSCRKSCRNFKWKSWTNSQWYKLLEEITLKYLGQTLEELLEGFPVGLLVVFPAKLLNESPEEQLEIFPVFWKSSRHLFFNDCFLNLLRALADAHPADVLYAQHACLSHNGPNASLGWNLYTQVCQFSTNCLDSYNVAKNPIMKS